MEDLSTEDRKSWHKKETHTAHSTFRKQNKIKELFFFFFNGFFSIFSLLFCVQHRKFRFGMLNILIFHFVQLCVEFVCVSVCLCLCVRNKNRRWWRSEALSFVHYCWGFFKFNFHGDEAKDLLLLVLPY